MRKIIILAVVLLAVGAFFVQRRLNVDIDPAAFLAADTLIYVDQHQAAARGQRFLASPLGKAVASIDLPGLLRDLGAPVDVQANVEKTLGDFQELTKNKITAELLGDRFAVAMLPRRDWMGKPGALPDPRRQLVLLCKPRHGATAIDLLSSMFSGDLKTESIPYGKYSLKRFKNDQISFVACAVDGWLVAAFEERALRESLDIFDAGNASLAGSEKFRKVTASLAGKEQIVYLSLNGLVSFAKDAVTNIPAKDQADLAGLFSIEPGLDAFAYGSQVQGDILQERMLISLVPERASEVTRAFLATPPQKDAFLPHLRDNLLFYSYTNFTDWSELGHLNAQNRAMVEAFSGHSLDELQKMLGNGPSRLFVRKGEGGQIPLPLVNFCVAAAAPEKLGEIASSLLAKTGIEMSKGKFQDASYQVWSQAPEQNMRFYSALWRDQWCVGNSLDFFKEIAEPSPKEASLLTAKDFKVVGDGISQPAQSLMYIRVDQSLDLLHDAFGALATLLGVEDKELPAKMRLINERLIFPLLDGAKMYKRSFSHGAVENNMLRIDSKTSMVPQERQ